MDRNELQSYKRTLGFHKRITDSIVGLFVILWMFLLILGFLVQYMGLNLLREPYEERPVIGGYPTVNTLPTSPKN